MTPVVVWMTWQLNRASSAPPSPLVSPHHSLMGGHKAVCLCDRGMSLFLLGSAEGFSLAEKAILSASKAGR